MRTPRHAKCIVGVLSVVAAAATTAHGYVVAQTSTGARLHWEVFPITWNIGDTATPDVSAQDALAAVRQSFSAWDGVASNELRFTYDGTTSATYSNVVCINGVAPGEDGACDDQVNSVVWTETDWQESPDAIALTYNLYFASAGNIFESDITLNGERYTWSTSDDAVQMDISNIVAHEIGHMVGLGHSEDADATMFGTALSGEVKKRTLNEDDEAAIQDVYRNGGGAGARGGDLRFGCGVAKVRASSFVSVILLTMIVTFRRRR